MKIIKRILIIIGILIAIPLIVALFVNGEYNVKREVDIKKPKAQVFEYIKYVKNQDYFSKWNMMDPNMKKSYKGTDGTVGFVYSWEGNPDNVGTGEQEIIKITEGERMDFKLRFKVPFEAQDDAYMITTATDTATTHVTWGFSGKMPYPMNFMCLFMNMDEMVGPDLATGLENLKAVMEKQ